jgi:XTP/dITP diphosphohydrolase
MTRYPPHQLLLATNNPGKVKELKGILSNLPSVNLQTPSDLGINIQLAETGNTYAENAALKALTYSQESELIALADDSGLEVDVLDGEPGIHSARYAPMPDATDKDRREFLLTKLMSKPQPWIARFRCSIAIALPHGVVHFTQGDCEGQIVSEERGDSGFGYDPIFLLPKYQLTMAELEFEFKNQISHRAKACRAALPFIRDLLNL